MGEKDIDVKQIAHDLQEGHGCIVSKSIGNLAFDEQLRVLRRAAEFAGTEQNKPLIGMAGWGSQKYAYAAVSAGLANPQRWGRLYDPPGYKVELDLHTGIVSSECHEPPETTRAAG